MKNVKSILFILISVVAFTAIFSFPIYSKPKVEKSRFYSSHHNKLNDKTLEKVLQDLHISLDEKTLKRWKKLLNKALWHQDLLAFLGSRHHFDNCAFSEGIEQINQHFEANEADYLKLQNTTNEKEKKQIRERIIFRTGRLLHSTQDFFSHSNFVELMQEKHSKIEEVPLADFWTKEGQKQILQLSRNDLVSEKFFLSFPHRCTQNNSQTQNLSKDSPKKMAGKKITRWKNFQTNSNYTAFEAAMIFAEKSTYHILFQTLDIFLK